MAVPKGARGKELASPPEMARTRYASGTESTSLKSLPAAALRACLREGYGAAELRRDALAGAVVGVVALPLSMALSIAVGMPPQHGLYTAIVAGLFVALLGGSRTQVTGPTAAFIVILAPITAQFGAAGLLVSGLLGGLLLLGMGLLRLGKLIQYIPHPVTTGFTAGIGTVIAVLQLKDFLGLEIANATPHLIERMGAMWSARASASLPEFAIGALTLIALIGLPRLTSKVPAPLIALPLAAIVAALLSHLLPGWEVATVGSRFETLIGGELVRGIPQLPPLPVLPWNAGGAEGEAFVLNLETLRALLPGAFAIAILGAIESLLSAVVADGMVRTRHDPDSELLALGAGNILAPFFGGIPATGAIARTATNIRSGGRSPVAAMVHALVVLSAVLAAAPIIAFLPMASLAALLLLVAWNMSEARHFVHTLKVAPRGDVAVLLTCYGLTVVFDMVVAVGAGIVLAAMLFMRRMAELTSASLRTTESHDGSLKIPADVVVYEIAGPLFFGAAQKALGALDVIAERPRALILQLENVPTMDATGLVALESALSRVASHGTPVILCGLQEQPRELLERAGLFQRLPGLSQARDLSQALATVPSPPESAVTGTLHSSHA